MQPPYRGNTGQNLACCFLSLCHGEMNLCRRKYCGQHSGRLDSIPLCTGTGQAKPPLLVWLFFVHSTRNSLAQLSPIGSLPSLSDCSGQLWERLSAGGEECHSCHHYSWTQNHLQLPCSWWAHESLPTKRWQGGCGRRGFSRKAGGTFLSLPKYKKNQPQSRLKTFTYCHTDQSFPIPHRSKASAWKNVN